MIDISHAFTSLSAAAVAFGRPGPGLRAWLLPLRVRALHAGRLPAALQLPESIASQRAAAALATQLGVLPPTDVLDRPLVPGEPLPRAGWVRIEPVLLSYRFLRAAPPSELPALSCHAALAVRGQSNGAMSERLPAAASRTIPPREETFYLIVCAREGSDALEPGSALPVRPAAAGTLLHWLDAAIAAAGFQLSRELPLQLQPLLPALALGEAFALGPKYAQPAWLADVQVLPGKTFSEGLAGLARRIEDALGLDGDLWFEDGPPPSPLH